MQHELNPGCCFRIWGNVYQVTLKVSNAFFKPSIRNRPIKFLPSLPGYIGQYNQRGMPWLVAGEMISRAGRSHVPQCRYSSLSDKTYQETNERKEENIIISTSESERINILEFLYSMLSVDRTYMYMYTHTKKKYIFRVPVNLWVGTLPETTHKKKEKKRKQ